MVIGIAPKSNKNSQIFDFVALKQLATLLHLVSSTKGNFKSHFKGSKVNNSNTLHWCRKYAKQKRAFFHFIRARLFCAALVW